jgi:glycosyltransferase involved in cell wall biosynthesis
MRIYQIINKFFPGGAELVAISLHSELRTAAPSKLIALRPNPEKDSVSKLLDINPQELIEIECGKIKLRNMASLIQAARKFVRAYCDYDGPIILHSHCELPDLFLLIVRALCLFRRNIFIIRTVHNERYFGLKYGPLLDIAVSLFFKRTICVSEAIHSRLAWIRPTIIYNPIRMPTARRAEQFINKKFRVGIVGRLSYQKAQLPLIQYYVNGKFSDITLVFYGFSESDLRRQCDTLGNLPAEIEFKGFERNIDKIYNNIDILYIPSLFEGLSSVMVEALARGVPVYSNRVSGTIDISKIIEQDICVNSFSELATLIRSGTVYRVTEQMRNNLKSVFGFPEAAHKHLALYRECA